MTVAEKQSRFVGIEDAACYLGVSSATVRKLVSEEKLTALRIVPGRVLLDRREIDKVALASASSPRCTRGRRSQELRGAHS